MEGGEAELSSPRLRGPHLASPGYRQNTTQDPHSGLRHILGYNRDNVYPRLWSGRATSAILHVYWSPKRGVPSQVSLRGQGHAGAQEHEDKPEVSFLAAAALLHGVQRTHAPVFLKPHPI